MLCEKSNETLSELEIDAIGEVMNISMGAAATAMSTMLDKQVIITTPNVSMKTVGEVNYATLEPAMLVKITYVKGISGSNVMVFRQMDMQLILNQLMGRDDPPSEDFIFDELSMSAACEVMNQMMGASATALSGFLGKSINISTPEASIMDDKDSFANSHGLSSEDPVVAILFNLQIDHIINSEFIIVMNVDLAKGIVSQLMGNTPEENVSPAEQEVELHELLSGNPTPISEPSVQPVAPLPQQTPPSPVQPTAPMPNQPPVMPPYPQPTEYAPIPDYYGGVPGMPAGYPPMPYYPYGYPPIPPQYYQQPIHTPVENKQENCIIRKSVDVLNPQFPSFSTVDNQNGESVLGSNMDLIMNVALNVSVEIGKTKKKIKEIMDYTQGTVIELEKQAGAPVDIIVNGQLIARGDVVVIDDNFGVRITEIIGTKELIKSL